MNTVHYYEEIGKRIRAARKEIGLSQSELAKELNKGSATYVALIELGQRKVSIEVLSKISKVLHKPMSYFLDEAFDVLPPKEVIKVGLRADHELTKQQQEEVLHYYEFVKIKSSLKG